jgi:hypothetical protein
MRRRLPWLLALLLALPVAPAQAQTQPQAADAAPATTEAAPEVAPETQAAEVFARMDADRDGQLSLEEFERGITRPFGSQRQGVVYQKLPAHFRVLDADGDGFLDASEYEMLAQRWPLPGAPPMLAAADRNHDGRIDFREFVVLHVPREARAVATPHGAAPGATR